MINNIIDKQIGKRISLYTILLYAIEFLAYNFYMTTMIGNVFDIISIQYLYTGVMCAIPFLTPLVFLNFNYQNRTDNASKTYLTIPKIFSITLLFGFFSIFPFISDGFDKNYFFANKLFYKIGFGIFFLHLLIDIFWDISANIHIDITSCSHSIL